MSELFSMEPMIREMAKRAGIVYLRCSCGSDIWKVTQRVLGCAVCGTAIGLHIKNNEQGFPELTTPQMNRVLSGENPEEVYGSKRP